MMPKFVVLGSCLYEPYVVLAMPNKLDPELYDSDHEKAYEEACKVFYPAIDEADFVIVYAPDGLKDHPHTRKDIEYAEKQGKNIIIVTRKVIKVEV